MVYLPNHPLALKGGLVSEHRMIVYENIGPGPHPCHWCGTPVDWMPRQGLRRGALVVDHVDDDWRNNSLDNLVPSCQPCNKNRSAYLVSDDELFIVTASGVRRRAVERVCEQCGTRFLTAKDQARTPGKARFCSRSCARKQPHHVQ